MFIYPQNSLIPKAIIWYFIPTKVMYLSHNGTFCPFDKCCLLSKLPLLPPEVNHDVSKRWETWIHQHWWRRVMGSNVMNSGKNDVTHACDVITRMTSRVTSFWCQSDQGRSPEYAKFWILKIRPLLREIRPFLWNDLSLHFVSVCVRATTMSDQWSTRVKYLIQSYYNFICIMAGCFLSSKHLRIPSINAVKGLLILSLMD